MLKTLIGICRDSFRETYELIRGIFVYRPREEVIATTTSTILPPYGRPDFDRNGMRHYEDGGMRVHESFSGRLSMHPVGIRCSECPTPAPGVTAFASSGGGGNGSFRLGGMHFGSLFVDEVANSNNPNGTASVLMRQRRIGASLARNRAELQRMRRMEEEYRRYMYNGPADYGLDYAGGGSGVEPESESPTVISPSQENYLLKELPNLHSAVECPRCHNSFRVDKEERMYTCTDPSCGHEFDRKGLMHRLKNSYA